MLMGMDEASQIIYDDLNANREKTINRITRVVKSSRKRCMTFRLIDPPSKRINIEDWRYVCSFVDHTKNVYHVYLWPECATIEIYPDGGDPPTMWDPSKFLSKYLRKDVGIK